MGSREAKDALFEAIAPTGKGFASPVRLELLDLSAQAPRSVEQLARVDTISREASIERLGRGDVVLVDARPSEEYAAGHIEGARSCRTASWAQAQRAFELGERDRLRAGGHSAGRLTDGWPEWRLAAKSEAA